MTIHITQSEKTTTPIFALHSSASNGGQWAALTEAFQFERGVIAPNLPGYGPVSGRINADSTAMARLASPIIDQMQAHNAPVHLVGHSFGGAVAIHIALNRPDLIASLSVYEPASFHVLREGNSMEKRIFAEIDALADTLATSIRAGEPAQGMMRFIDFWNGAGCWDSFSEKKRAIMAELAGTVLSNFDDGSQEPWTPEDLANIQAPTLVMEGTRSPAVSRCVTAAIARSIPGAMVATFGDLGHMAPAVSPERIFPVLRDHISIVEKTTMDLVWPLKSAA